MFQIEFGKTNVEPQYIAALPKLILALLIIILFYTWRYYATPRPVAGQLILHFLDVGQGDATLIQTPENKLILVDGGPDGKVLMSKLSPFFLDGHCQLEAVVLTHPDMDHMTGLLEALDRCEIKTVVANTTTCTSFNCEEFNKEVRIQNTEGGNENRNEKTDNSHFSTPSSSLPSAISSLTSAYNNDVFKIDAVTLLILNPPSYQDFNDANTNDDSVVLLLTYGKYQALLTGDAENRTFGRIFNCSGSKGTACRAPTTMTLLKVPHHGSANNFDATVWERLRPEVAVISVGKNNYGQPSDKVLGEAAVLGTKVLRTDEAGNITIKISSNGNYEIK